MTRQIIKLILFLTVLTALPIWANPEASHRGQMVVLNGMSSCGKTSTADALQKALAQKNQPFIHLGSDNVMAMLPKEWVNLDAQNTKETLSDGLRFVRKDDDKGPKLTLEIGPVVARARNSVFAVAAAFASYGNNVILEGVITPDEMKIAKEVLRDFDPFFINIMCPLAQAEQREKSRKGFIGLARGIADMLKNQDVQIYDLQIDTANSTHEQNATKIMELMKRNPPRKFKRVKMKTTLSHS